MRKLHDVRSHIHTRSVHFSVAPINWPLVAGLGMTLLMLLAYAAHGAPKAKPKAAKTTAPQIARYRVNKAKSTFTVHSSTRGLLVHDRESVVTNYTGEVKLRVTNQKSGSVPRVVPVSLVLTAQANSLRSQDDLSDADRNRIDVNVRDKILEANRFPVVKFQSTRLIASQNGTKGSVQIQGTLTLHGVTRKVAFPATVTGNDKSLRARGSFGIKQSDFGIQPFSYLGAITVNDPVKFTFSIACDRVR